MQMQALVLTADQWLSSVFGKPSAELGMEAQITKDAQLASSQIGRAKFDIPLFCISTRFQKSLKFLGWCATVGQTGVQSFWPLPQTTKGRRARHEMALAFSSIARLISPKSDAPWLRLVVSWLRKGDAIFDVQWN
jgi:hypothetical protein